jgi:SAM-dependent methyltransferase
MPIDHSKTYRLNDLRGIGHTARLKDIFRIIDKIAPKGIAKYADFGCSNGFITNQIADRINIESAFGFDWSGNVEVAKINHPRHQFGYFNLNQLHASISCFDLVTCFETIEHTGNPRNAIANLLASRGVGGILVITVPIEIGLVGLVKYLIKRFLYRYGLPLSCNDGRYIRALLSGERISKFRKPSDGYGSHFGFDYRDVDDYIQDAIWEADEALSVQAWNRFSTRFYLISPKNLD